MFLVSNFKKVLTLLVIGVVTFGVVMLVTPSSAEASTGQARPQTLINTSRVESFPLGILASSATPAPASTQASALALAGRQYQWDWVDDVTNVLNDAACMNLAGAALSATTGVCDDTPVGTVVEGIEDALDCATDLPECITRWIYDVVGAGVSWITNGIVGLITGTQTSCIRAADGARGSGEWESISVDCENRIRQDYFPSGYIQERKLTDVMSQSTTDQRRDIRANIATLNAQGMNPNPDLEAARQAQLDGLRTQLAMLNNGDADNPLAANPTVGSVRAQNSLFYVSKSAISTPVWDREYGKYVLIGLLLLVPMIIAAALQAVISGKAGTMLRAVLFHMPVAIIGMIAAPWMVKSLMSITDSFSAFIISDVHGDVDGFFTNPDTAGMLQMGIPLLMGFTLVALIFIFAGILVWFILSMREASVALISVFLPIAFAASVWPALGKWALRAIKLLVAAIISKVFIVGALSLGIGTFGGSTSTGNISISHMIFGATIFFIAAFSPHLVMKFFDEIGESINAAGGTGAFARGMGVAGNMNGARQLIGFGGGGGGAGGGGGGGAGALTSGGIAGSLAASMPGATPGSVAAANAGGVIGAGGSASQAASGGGNGARQGGGGAADQLGGAYAGAAAHVAPGQAMGTMNAQQAEAVGSAVGQAAINDGATPVQAAQMATDATNQAAAPGALAAGQADQVGQRTQAQGTAQRRSERKAQTRFSSKLGRLAMNMSPVGNVAYGIGAARRRTADATRPGP